MKKKNRKLPIAAALVLALFAGKIYAAPGFNTSSPQSDVTLGIFESDADYFMSVRNYANMDFTKWWGSVSYKYQGDTSLESSQLAQLGFAARFGNVYAGLAYRGNGWLQFGKIGRTNDHIYNYSKQKAYGKTWKVFSSDPYPLSGDSLLRNEAAVLIGLADMGFKLYYASNYQTNKQTDFAIGNSIADFTFIKSLLQEKGHINPGLTWGMTRDLIPGIGIKPQVNIDLDFNRENEKRELFVSSNPDPNDPSTIDFSTPGMRIYSMNNYFAPGIDLGLGGITFTKVNDFSLGFDVDYGIKVYFYNNEYSYSDAAGRYHIKKIRGGWVYNESQFADKTEIINSLFPAIAASWSGERLALTGKLGMAMSFHTIKETFYKIKAGSNDGSLEKHGEDKKNIENEYMPVFNLALQWAIVPSRLFLNAGGQLRVFKINHYLWDKHEYLDGKEDPDPTRRIIETRNALDSASTTLFLGLTFNITARLELQAALGITSNNDINVFDFSGFTTDARGRGNGGLVNFGNILMSLKF
ncbi:MAG: hypothetical protein FWH41_08000 [Treponema sp.]|nr:hypothetical protein [Treponema sp.]